MYKKRFFCFWKIFRNRKGFTMTEVVVVLSVLGIMTAISVPSYISWLPRHKLQTSVRQIYDDLNLAKMQAVRRNTDLCITFNTAAETYTVFLDLNSNAIQDDGAGTILKNNVALENGVVITTTTFTLTPNTSGFNNRGMLPTLVDSGQVRLTNPTGLLMGVDVNAAGGISIVTSTDGWTTWS